jgi:hypothetical protein
MSDQEQEFQIDSYRLFLDVSSACTGYVVAKINSGGSNSLARATCEIVRAGAIWYPKDWTNEKKNYYMFRIISDDFYVISAITDIIYERYSFSPKQRAGSLVVPEMIGAIKVAAFDTGELPLGVEDIPPNVWRSQLGIKADVTVSSDGKKSRDYKEPCIRYMKDQFGDKIPDQIISNVTGNLRATPNDVYDAFGVCMGWHKKFGVNKFKIADNAFNVSLMDTDV